MMESLILYYPTAVLFIDDNWGFIKDVSKSFPQETSPIVPYLFSSPKIAIDFANQDTFYKGLLGRIIRSNAESDHQIGEETLSIYSQDIIHEVYQQQRFKQISVAVIDYEMPGINGIEVCQSIQNKNIKKILLTGVANEKIATQAFNQGLIYQYIRKHDTNFITKLHKVIRKAQRQYFEKISNIFNDAVKLKHKDKYNALISLKPLINSIIKKYNIVEYYLIDNIGSLCMFNAFGDHYGFFVFGEEEINEMLITAEDIDAPQSIINDIKNRKKALCYFNPDSPHLPGVENWTPYFHSINRFGGKEGYYYTLQPNIIPINKENYFSFHQFINEKYSPK